MEDAYRNAIALYCPPCFTLETVLDLLTLEFVTPYQKDMKMMQCLIATE